jgi:hypothetical protein
MISAVFAVALMAAAGPAAAGAAPTGAAPAGTPAKSEKADKNGMVCKREPVLGSRMKERICLTQADWDARKAQAKDDLDTAQRNQPMNTR